MKVFKDRDYIRTGEDLLFCVAGYLHPPERVIAYLKYVPEKEGGWGSGAKRFTRALPYYTIKCLKKTLDFLHKNYPQYIFNDPTVNGTFSSVPVTRIKSHYCPEEKIKKLVKKSPKDSLQLKTIELASLLSERSGVPLRFFGVTGSVLLDIHNPSFSDMDLTVYGYEHSLKVKHALLDLYSEKNSRIKKFSGKQLEEWCESKRKLYPLTVSEANEIYRRIWNRGTFNGTMFSIHPIKLEREILEFYGEKTFNSEGIVEVEAVVEDVSGSMFLPCVYKVRNVNVLSDLKVNDIFEVVSYEGLYSDILSPGETLLAKGKLEKVCDLKRGTFYHRVLIGSLEGKGEDYIKFKI
jgi:predicted nucleotidyltransferase